MSKKFPVAIQVYSVRDDAEKDLKGVLQQIKAMGYDGVEFAGLYGHAPAEVKAMCEEVGLVPLSAHVALLEMLEDPKGVLSAYAEVGCKYVAIPYLTEEYRPGQEKFAEVIEAAKLLGSICNELGMKLLYHNHDFEFLKVDGKYALDILYDSVDADLLQTELDVCWVNVSGENPPSYIRKYTGRAPVVHLKDFYMEQGKKAAKMYDLIGIDDDTEVAEEENVFEFRPVGYGVQDFPAILDAAADAGAAWVVVEQDQPSMGKTPLECAKMSVEYVKSIME